jgi:CheY-like chemotaxis protein
MRRILIVDDEPDVRLMLRTLLARRDWEVEEASSGEDAVARWRDGSFDAVVLDQKMSEMDGIDAAAVLKGAGCDVPIFIYSAYLNSSVEHLAATLGVRVASKGDLVQHLLEALQDI